MRLEIDIEQLRTRSIELVEEHARQARERIHEGKTDEYTVKLAEARDLSQDTPVIDAESDARGIGREDMAQMVIDADKRAQERMKEITVIRGPVIARLRGAKDRAVIARLRCEATQALDTI